MKKLGKLILVFFTAVIFIVGCSNPQETETETEAGGDKLQIVTSMFPMYEITKKVAGDRGELSLMVGPNEDAHHYEPSAQAVASVNEADIFIYSSDEMEFWVESLLAVVENDDLQVVELGEGIDFNIGTEAEAEDDHGHDQVHEEDGHNHNHGALDPHFWLNPVAVENQLPLLVEALSTKDPTGSEAYESNAANFSNELSALDEAYEEAFADAKNRSFVVQHQAFGHLANEYDLNQIAVGGLSTEVEPDPEQLAEIVEFVRAQDVPVVYYQSGESPAIAETIAEETGTEIGVLHDLERAPADISPSDNLYIELMYENLQQLKKSIY